MTISTVTASSLSTLIGEFGPKYFERGINQASPLIKSKLLPKTDPDGEEYVVDLFPSASHATGVILDAGRLPTGGSGSPVKARALPAVIVSVLSQGRAASKMGLSDDRRTRLLDQEMKERSADVGRILNRAIIGGSISPQAGTTWSATSANATATVSFLDISLFREGMAVDFIDLSSSKGYVVRVTAVTPSAVGANSANVAGTVSFINDIPDPSTSSVVALTDTTIATGDSFQIRGATAGFGGSSTLQGALLNSFDSMAGGAAGASATASFMGQDPATMGVGYNWRANYLSAAAAYNQEIALGFAARIATVSGVAPDVVVMHPQLAAAHKASGGQQSAAAFGMTAGISSHYTRSLDSSVDKYGNSYEDDGLRLSGAKVLQDPNCQPGRAIFFNSEYTKLCVWSEMGPDEEAGESVLLGRSFYTNEVQFSGLYNLVTDKRSTVGILDGFTSL